MARKPRPNRNRRGGPGRGGRPPTHRHFPRTARLNTLLQEIVADYFERVEDERFQMLTITGVEVDNDLNRAQVFVSDLGFERSPENEDGDSVLLEALAEHRKPVKGKIGREARIRKTPEVVFAIDPGVRAGARIEQILSDLRDGDDTGSSDNESLDSGSSIGDQPADDGDTDDVEGFDDGAPRP